MNKTKTLCGYRLFSFPQMAITSFLCFGLLLFANFAIAQSSSHNGGQWSSVGGKIVASGEGHFSNKWSRSTRYWNGDGNYWKNDEPPSNKAGKIPATHTLEEVTKDVSIRKGQITVRGPGYLGLFIRSKGAGAALKFPKSGKVFYAQGLGEDKWLHDPQNNWKWYPGEVFNADPTNPNLMGGWVPVGRTMTLDVWVYNPFSEWGVWGSGYSAPKSVEYEFWFFPIKGGKVIKVAEAPDKNVMDNIDTPPPVKSANVVDTPPTYPPYKTPPIHIYAFEGDEVEVDLYGTGEFVEVTKDKLPIEMGPNGRVITGFDSKATIIFGKRGVVYVKQLTNYQVGEFLITDEGITVHTNMKVGEINVKVDRKYKAADFTVSSPTCTISVRGTEFTMSHEESPMKSTVTVYSGKVEVTPKLCSEPARILTAGQRITVDENCFGELEVFEPKDADEPGIIDGKQDGILIYPIADSHVYAYSWFLVTTSGIMRVAVS